MRLARTVVCRRRRDQDLWPSGRGEVGNGVGGEPVLGLQLTDIGEGAAWGAGIGAGTGTAAAAGSPGNQVSVVAGTALELRLTRPVRIDALTEVAAAR